MYIPDDRWDNIVSLSLHLMDDPQVTASTPLFNLIHHLIHLEDSPLPRKKRVPLKGFHKIKKGRDMMRKFTKYFMVRLAGESISKLKKRKRKSTIVDKPI